MPSHVVRRAEPMIGKGVIEVTRAGWRAVICLPARESWQDALEQGELTGNCSELQARLFCS